jgi:hypothetical protein
LHESVGEDDAVDTPECFCGVAHCISVDSVDPDVIGRFVDVLADLARVEVRHAGRLVAVHDRVWARGMTITDPAHVAIAQVLREQYQLPRSAGDPDEELGRDLARDLADYDRAFGLIDGGLSARRGDGEEVASWRPTARGRRPKPARLSSS